MKKIKRFISMLLATVIACSLCVPVMAAESRTDSITIYFGSEDRSNGGSGFETGDVKEFFVRNGLDYDYYRKWLYNQELTGLEKVTFSVGRTENDTSQKAVNSGIQNRRIIYADRNYHHNAKTNQFTVGELMKNVVSEGINLTIGKYSQFIASLASIFGITDPDTYFGTDKVRMGQDYYVNDGANRVVTKFVELYAPVSGTVKWYPWGYAEGDYVRHGVQLYYKGLETKPKKNIYHQYYTEHYYAEQTLVTLTEQAYSRGQVYSEVADDYAASSGGYALIERDISESKYLEYDDKVVN